MRTVKIVFVFLIAVLANACSNQPQFEIATDYRDFDYSTLKTYHWREDTAEDKEAQDYPVLRQRFTSNINRVLSEKGFTLDESNPDFIVHYGVTTEDRLDINTYQSYEGYAPGFNFTADDGFQLKQTREETTETSVKPYVYGRLIIDIMDTKSKIIWRGRASKKFYAPLDKGTRDKVAKEAVEKILAEFPPK